MMTEQTAVQTPQAAPAIRERGYLNVYTTLTTQERRQLGFVRRYKQEHPQWDATMILAERLFAVMANRLRAHGQAVTMLDAGCGRGNYCLDEHRTLVESAVGVDQSAAATQGNMSCDRIVYASLDALPFADASFSLITALWVFEHLREPQRVVTELFRVLAPGGFFLAVTPNAQALLLCAKRLFSDHASVWVNRHMFGRATQDVFPTWYRANTVRLVRRLLTNAGFHNIAARQNFDPGYTSFDERTYRLSCLLAHLPAAWSAPHLLISASKAA